MSLTRGAIKKVERDGLLWKVCECSALFLPETNRRDQETSRALCDACRALRPEKRRGGLLQATVAAAPRCATCDCVIGLALGGQTHVDAAGNCPSCARWLRNEAVRVAERAQRERAGFTPVVWPVKRAEVAA